MPKFIISLVVGFALALSNYCFSENALHSDTAQPATREQKQPHVPN